MENTVKEVEVLDLGDFEIQSFDSSKLSDQEIAPSEDASCGDWICFITPSICGSC